MYGIHDLGGKQGFGPMPTDRDELPFHHDWEPLTYIFAILAAQRGWWTFDAGRHAIERIPPREYMRASYFERVLVGISTLFVEHGIVPHEALEDRAGGPKSYPLSSPIGEGHNSRGERPPFAVGDRVSVSSSSPTGHSRSPGYVHGKRGIIVGIAPKAKFPGQIAHQLPATEEHSYHVRFEGHDIWDEVEDGSSVVVDLFGSYLDRVS